MHKYHFNIRLSNVRYNHAGSKAVEDCKTILLSNGFKDIEIPFIKKAYMMPVNIIKLFCLLAYYKYKVEPGSLIVVQYPLLGINKYFKYFASLLKSKNCRLVSIIHDLDSIRSNDNQQKIEAEIANLNVYDAVIAHNEAMKSWLLQNGYAGKICLINLFDYLVSDQSTSIKIVQEAAPVAFAGNLGRCKFLSKLPDVTGVKFNLYGPGLEEAGVSTTEDIEWKGSFSPEKIVSEISGQYGLIWDGTSIENYTGIMGDYLKYNTPHKTSLYLVSGLPVIVHSTAAIANYIKSNKLGIVVNSLIDLKSQLNAVSNEQYTEMKNSALQVSKKLKAGYFLKTAIDWVIDNVCVK
jgi:hypothetical protein